jgi:hypothetical protein
LDLFDEIGGIFTNNSTALRTYQVLLVYPVFVIGKVRVENFSTNVPNNVVAVKKCFIKQGNNLYITYLCKYYIKPNKIEYTTC